MKALAACVALALLAGGAAAQTYGPGNATGDNTTGGGTGATGAEGGSVSLVAVGLLVIVVAIVAVLALALVPRP